MSDLLLQAPQPPTTATPARREHRVGWISLLATLCLGAAGCVNTNLQGDGFGDDTAHWAENLRKPTSQGQISGFDTRAKEIERNLGYR